MSRYRRVRTKDENGLRTASELICLEVPYQDGEPPGYATRRIDMHMTPAEALTMDRVLEALRGRALPNTNRLVQSPADVVRWLLAGIRSGRERLAGE